MRYSKGLILILFLLLSSCFVFSANTNVLSEEEKRDLGQKLANANQSLKAATDAAIAADKETENLRLHDFINNAAELSNYFKNGTVDRFGFGLSAAAQAQTYIVDKGKGLETAMNLNEHLFADLRDAQSLGKEVREGVGLVLLQEYYKLGRWPEGRDIIEEIRKAGITSSLFIREVAGFTSGIIANTHLTNEALSMYESVIPTNKAEVPRGFSYGEAFFNLSGLYGTYGRADQQLSALNRISNTDSSYSSTNGATLAYWKYDAYSKMNQTSNAVEQLIISAKEYKAHPEFVTDDVIRRDLPKLLKAYQDHGFIAGDLTVAAYKEPSKEGFSSSSRNRSIVLILMIGVTICFVFIMIRTLRKHAASV
jgi:hypothetical protein